MKTEAKEINGSQTKNDGLRKTIFNLQKFHKGKTDNRSKNKQMELPQTKKVSVQQGESPTK